jgi:hypothetical protein
MFGPLTHHKNKTLPDLSVRELCTFVPLLVFIFFMGLYPKPYLKRMEPSVDLFIKEFKIKFNHSQRHLGPLPKQLPELSYRGRVARAKKQMAIQLGGGR